MLAVQQRGSVCRGPEVARARRAARQRRVRSEPHGRGRRVPSRAVHGHPPRYRGAAQSRRPVPIGASAREAGPRQG
eukprot:4225272-Alexandrium_andersonii.AAC.1